MPITVNALSEKRDPLSNNAKQDVTTVFDAIKRIVEKRLNKFKTMPNLYNHLLNKVS